MPRDIDDEPVARPTAKRKKSPAVEAMESGPWKALGITFGCVLVAFAGVMTFVMSKSPKGTDVAVGDPTNSRFPTPNDPKPNPGPPPKADPNAPQPDDWTPPPLTRPASPLKGATRVSFAPDAAVPPQRWGSSPDAAYLDRHGLVFAVADNNRSSLVGFDEKARAAVPPPPDLKAGDGVGSVTATADQSAVFAAGNGRMFRFVVDGRRWESAPITGVANYLAIATDRLLAVERRFKDTQFRLYRWPVGGSEIALAARWEVDGETAAATYDATAGVLWVVRASKPDAPDATLDRFAMTGRGGILQASVPLPFAVGVVAPPVLSPDGRRVYVKDRAVEGDRLLPTKYAGEVTAAVGGVVFLSGSGFADAETGALIGHARDDVYKLAFASDGAAVWGADLSGKTPVFRRFAVTAGAPPKPPVGPTDPTPPVGPTDPKPLPGTPFAVLQVTQLATLPAPDRVLSAFRHSDKHNLLAYADLSGATILDTKTGDPLPLPKLDGKARLRAADFAPDQTALFASDGQNLHRLDLATRKWESRPNVGQRVLAIDGSTALVQVKLSNPATYALVRWGPTEVKEVSRIEWPYLYELGYDPVAKALFALHAKVNNSGDAVLEKYGLKDGAPVSEWSKKSGGATPKVTLRPLTGDGGYFFQGQQAWATIADERPITQYPELLVGATRTALVGASGKLYAAGNVPARIGTFPQTVEAVAASADGRTVWVASRTAKKFIQYQIEPSAKKQ